MNRRGGNLHSSTARDVVWAEHREVDPYGSAICVLCEGKFKLPMRMTKAILCNTCWKESLAKEPGFGAFLGVLLKIEEHRSKIKKELNSKMNSTLREEFLRGELFILISIREELYRSSAVIRNIMKAKIWKEKHGED